jgi:hypothetical protein
MGASDLIIRGTGAVYGKLERGGFLGVKCNLKGA